VSAASRTKISMNATLFRFAFASLGFLLAASGLARAQGGATCSTANYCVAAPNSAGSGALMSSDGEPDLGANDFILIASGVPAGQPGLFFYGPGQTQVPMGDGFRCVAGTAFRLNPPVSADASGIAQRWLDFSQPPANGGPGLILEGSTWNFQFWYRDPQAGGFGFNLSDGLEVIFCRSSAGATHWATARHDNQRSARSPVVASQTPSLLFDPRSSGSGDVPSTAAEGSDGSVYFSNGGELRAVDPNDGSTLWTFAATGPRKVSAPAVGADGTIYASQTGGSQPALVVALAGDGSPRWVYTTSEIVAYFSDLAVDAGGRVFGRYLETQFTQWNAFALDPAGNLQWKTSVPYTYEFDPTPPALLSSGDVVLTGEDAAWNDRLMRLDGDTGAILWSIAPGGSLSGPVIADNGLILVHSPGPASARGVSAFDPDSGALVWRVPYLAAEYGENNPPVLLPGGEIVAIANGDDLGNRLIYRISPDGVLLDTVPYPSSGYYVDSIAGGDGTLYVWTSMRLMAFSPVTGAVKFEYYPAPTAGCLRTSQATILSSGSVFATWQRNQTCNSPMPFGQFVTLAPPQ